MAVRILLVDVDEPSRAEFRLALGQEGWDVQLADRREVRTRVRDHPPDVIVLAPDREFQGWLREDAPAIEVLAPKPLSELLVELRSRFPLPARLPCSGGEVRLDEGTVVPPTGDPIRLTSNELALLRFLVAREGRTVSEAELLEKVWGYRPGIRSRAVAKAVYRLRRKIEADPSEARNLVTAFGSGYRLILGPTEAVLAPVPRGNVPASRDAFVGHAGDLQTVGRRLEEARLVTLIGPGGVGKSRFALELARAADFFDAVWRVDLTAARDDLLQPISTTLSLRLQGAVNTATVAEGLGRAGRVLLLLDNGEHVVEELAELVAELLDRCPQLVVLVTSRVALNIRGEHRHPVPPLRLPAEPTAEAILASEAGQLFARRAEARDPTFEIVDPVSVTELLAFVDGLPLAVELLAARASGVDAAHLLRALRTSWSVLTDDRRDQPLRHRSLRATVQHSWDLLAEDDQILVHELSVFEGGWTFEAAEAVGSSPDVASGLVRLLDQSWIQRDGTRYLMLLTIAQFARDQGRASLGETRARHADWFGTRQVGPDDLANTMAAARWSLATGDAARLHRAVLRLSGFAQVHGPQSLPLEFARAALDLDLSDLARSEILATLATAEVRAMRTDQAMAYANRAYEHATLAGDPSAKSVAAIRRAEVYRILGEERRCRALLRDAVAFSEESGDRARRVRARVALGQALARDSQREEAMEQYALAVRDLQVLQRAGEEAYVLCAIAVAQLNSGDVAASAETLATALPLAKRSGHRHAEAEIVLKLAWIAMFDGDLAAARDLATQSVDLFHASGIAVGVVFATSDRGMFSFLGGDLRSARDDLEDAVGQARRLGIPPGEVGGLGWLARVYGRAGLPAAASRALERAEQLVGTEPSENRFHVLLCRLENELEADLEDDARARWPQARAMARQLGVAPGSPLGERFRVLASRLAPP